MPTRSSKGTDHDFATVARRVAEQAMGEKMDGSPLDDPNKSNAVLQTLSSAASASVTVQRNGVPLEVNLNLETVASTAESALQADQEKVAEAYRTVPPENLAPRVKEVLAMKPHWITFTSSSTVKNLVGALGPLGGISALAGVRKVSIGPITSAALREHGLQVDAEADPHTIAGLVDAVCRGGD